MLKNTVFIFVKKMGRGLVQQRPFVKERKVASSFSSNKIAGLSFKKKLWKTAFYQFVFQKYLLRVIGSVLLVLLGLFFLKGTWYNPNYLIKDIEYTQETRAEYANTELFVLTSKYLRGKYLNAVQVSKYTELLGKIREEYPFVRDIQINYVSPQKVAVDFEYELPKLRIKLGDKLFWVRNNGLSTALKPERSLAQTGFVIDTPQYLTGTTSLSGFFYEVPYAWYTEHLPKIQEAFPEMTRFVYLAGSPNFLIFEKQKSIYLHRDNLDLQLQKYRWLQQAFANFTGVFEVDLGSFVQNKLIIKE